MANKSHTDQQYEAELTQIRDRLARMGGYVEQMIADAVTALVDHDAARASAVIDRDRDVDALEMDIDDLCIRVLARRQPAASDLRLLASTLKLVVDIERIGDLAANVSERVVELAERPPLKPYVDLPRMGRIAREMVSDALDAWQRKDAVRARTVFPRDNVVDALYSQVLRDLLVYMTEDPGDVYRATRLLSVAKHLERIGDHAMNLAEQAIFLVEGRDVRHKGLGKPKDDPRGFQADLKGVLFVCGANAARSQMAEAWARHLAPPGVQVASAGLRASQLHPLAVQVMAEVGIDIAGARSKALADLDLSAFDTVVTLCDEAGCIVVPGNAVHVHWPMQDPVPEAGGPGGIAAFRQVRDDLAGLVEHLFRTRNKAREKGL